LEFAFAEAQTKGKSVVVQAIARERRNGEKRLVVLDGQVIGGYLRRQAPGAQCHNLARGGIAETTEITRDDHVLVQSLSKELRAHGIRIAGVDVIGDQIIEVNVLNPGGIFHTDRLMGSSLAERILCRFEDEPILHAAETDTVLPRR
jgi:glutathione synthase